MSSGESCVSEYICYLKLHIVQDTVIVIYQEKTVYNN